LTRLLPARPSWYKNAEVPKPKDLKIPRIPASPRSQFILRKKRKRISMNSATNSAGVGGSQPLRGLPNKGLVNREEVGYVNGPKNCCLCIVAGWLM